MSLDHSDFAKRHAEQHRLYLIEQIQEKIDKFTDSHPLTLSSEDSFHELRGMQVALDQRALAVTDHTGRTHIVTVEDFVDGAITENYDQISRLRRALGQRIDGIPLCSGFGMEG